MQAVRVLGFGLAWTVIVGLALGPVDGSSLLGSHGPWAVSRAAGFASYLCLWAGVVGGLLMSSGWLDGHVSRARLLAIHQVGSITGVVLGVAHGLALIPDGWTDFTVLHVLVPFTAPEDTSLVALGVLCLWLAMLVSASFWLRAWIGVRTWRLVHYSVFVAYGAALWHGGALGTDAHEGWARALYFVTALSVVFAVALRLTYRRESPKRRLEAKAA
ncbi:MAG: hypothetical protein ACM3S1_08835 [Hyphomicrobiales bacterium]